jgi:serine/threonine protein kinase
MGTLEYMSPEQAAGESVDHRTDIWSLGIVLYEMLTGKTPFRSSSDVAVLHKIMNEKPMDVISLNPDVAPGLSSIVARTLAKDRRNRYKTVSEFLHAIRNYEFLPSTFHQDSALQEPYAVEAEAHKRVQKRVRAKLRFYRHLSFYLVVTFMLFLVNLMTSSRYFWFLWPALAWGTLVLLHWIGAFALRKDSSIRQRLLQEELDRELTKRN